MHSSCTPLPHTIPELVFQSLVWTLSSLHHWVALLLPGVTFTFSDSSIPQPVIPSAVERRVRRENHRIYKTRNTLRLGYSLDPVSLAGIKIQQSGMNVNTFIVEGKKKKETDRVWGVTGMGMTRCSCESLGTSNPPSLSPHL